MLASVPKDLFGGGTGAGISIQPVGFLVVQNGDVRLLQMTGKRRYGKQSHSHPAGSHQQSLRSGEVQKEAKQVF